MFKKLVKDLLTSKKFIVAAAGVVYATVGKKLGASADEVTKTVELVAAYLVGQGIADHGKEKAKVEASK
jgi:hypothetical protein